MAKKTKRCRCHKCGKPYTAKHGFMLIRRNGRTVGRKRVEPICVDLCNRCIKRLVRSYGAG